MVKCYKEYINKVLINISLNPLSIEDFFSQCHSGFFTSHNHLGITVIFQRLDTVVFKPVPFEDWTAVATLLLWGVLQYGVNLLGVNLWDSLDFNKINTWSGVYSCLYWRRHCSAMMPCLILSILQVCLQIVHV